MARPKKCRKVCQMPTTKGFFPMGNPNCNTAVILTIDEYEAIRLIDKLGYSQEECGNYMQVARTTVQMIYNTARKKLADALVDGLAIRIEGGDYQLCKGEHESCGCPSCRKHHHQCPRTQEAVSDTENAHA